MKAAIKAPLINIFSNAKGPAMKIRVKPTHPNVLNVPHPVDGKLKPEGGLWENDSFTARMLADGAVVEVAEDPTPEPKTK
jgi:hypothetical protein